MCGDIVGLMDYINSTNDPKGLIILSNVNILVGSSCSEKALEKGTGKSFGQITYQI